MLTVEIYIISYILIGIVVVGIACGIDKDFKPSEKDNGQIVIIISAFWPVFVLGFTCYGIFLGSRYVTMKIIEDFQASRKKEKKT